jgi:type IV pilus assembly protein PilB
MPEIKARKEQVVFGRGMELTLGEREMVLIVAGKGAPGRPTASYEEVAAVEWVGRRVRIEFRTPGPAWEFEAASAEAAAWAAEFVEQRRQATEAAQAAPSLASAQELGERLTKMLAPGTEAIGPAAQLLLHGAIALRASDVHLLPSAGGTALRVRVDGRLHEVGEIGAEAAGALAARLKTLAGLPSYLDAEVLSGRLAVHVGQRTVEVRLTSTPALGGEALALRIFDPQHAALALEQLGLEPPQQQALLAATRQAGLAVFTGPAGAGKTTTLYALAEHLRAQRGVSVVTIEQPPERAVPGALQINVEDLSGQWEKALVAGLRLDPEVLAVGEIRDRQTATLAAHAALAGHLLLTTLHAPGTAAVGVRLLQLGVAPYAVASALQVLVAQRLVRRVCANCAQPVAPDPQMLTLLGLREEAVRDWQLRRGRGCPACQGSGYAGRVACFEVWPVSERFRELVLALAPVEQFAQLRAAEVEVDARQAALLKAQRGETTLEEVARVFGLPAGSGATAP